MTDCGFLPRFVTLTEARDRFAIAAEPLVRGQVVQIGFAQQKAGHLLQCRGRGALRFAEQVLAFDAEIGPGRAAVETVVMQQQSRRGAARPVVAVEGLPQRDPARVVVTRDPGGGPAGEVPLDSQVRGPRRAADPPPAGLARAAAGTTDRRPRSAAAGSTIRLPAYPSRCS